MNLADYSQFPFLNSLYSRFLAFVVIVVLAAFGLTNTFWLNFLEKGKQERAGNMAQNMAYNMASTVVFFRNFPDDLRPQILQLLRDMGGARFFVSVNPKKLEIASITDSEIKKVITQSFVDAIASRLGSSYLNLNVDLSYPQTLNVFNDDTYITDLPDRWAQNVIILEPEPAPLLVAQFQIAEDEWLYLAGLFPEPFILSSNSEYNNSQIWFLSLVVILLLVLGWVLTRWLTNPLRTLSSAAQKLGREIHLTPVPEKGSAEVRQTAAAFNLMQRRLIKFIDDREHLFSAISHDLKTPITRLRLRSEFLTDLEAKAGIDHDLDELELLVRGALDFSRSTDIHEVREEIDLVILLEIIKKDYEIMGYPVSVMAPDRLYYKGNKLALKRCLANLIENAVFYGKSCQVLVLENSEEIQIEIIDQGSGIETDKLKAVLEPFVRLEGSRNRNTGGAGLGLSIANNIVRSHGGSMDLSNHEQGGLMVRVLLPLT